MGTVELINVGGGGVWWNYRVLMLVRVMITSGRVDRCIEE
jgi:hypothetical protein